jgi:signal transduction histidine kinase
MPRDVSDQAAGGEDRLQLVLELGQRVTSILDLDTLLPEACRLIAETFHYDLVGISLLDPLDASRLYQAAAFPKERSLPRTFRVPLDRGITGWVARSGRSRLANDVAQDPFYIPGPGRTTQSELDVPLRIGARTIGVLNVESEVRQRFAPADVPYLEGVGVLLAQAIQNAALARHGRDLAASEERARLARDLHDETIQALVAIARQLDLLELDLAERSKAHDRLDTLRGMVDRAREGLIRLSRNLRPMVLEDLGLVAALGALTEGLQPLGLQVDMDVVGSPMRLSPSIEYAIYRVAQEALNNAARHARVDTASLRLVFADDAVELTVQDQGAGFEAADPGLRQATSGTISMRDRANEIGAELQIASERGRGTSVYLVVPLRPTMVDHA